MALSKIKTNSIEDDAVTATQIATDAVDTAEIAADAVEASELANDAVDTNAVANNAVTLAKLADGTQGGTIYYGASGAPTELAAGTSGQFLKTLGTSANPAWGTVTLTTINTNADNRLVTGSGTADTLNAEANLTYDGTTVDIKNAGTASDIKLYCESSNAHYVSIKSPSHAGFTGGNWTLTLPGTDGAANEFLQTDGAGATSWAESVGATSWQSVKTSTVTAVAGEGYPVNTTAGAITVNLPAGSAGDVVEIVDYAGTADTNNITVSANGSEKIQGAALDQTIQGEREGVRFVYADATQGWIVATTGYVGTTVFAPFSASGGTESQSGSYNIHTYTSSGTFVVAGGTSKSTDYLILSGGGAGGQLGGGGAGGHLEGTVTVDAASGDQGGGTYTVTVGAGGAGSSTQPDVVGTNSVYGAVSSSGGGQGGGSNSTAANQAGDGGSGGGGNGIDYAGTGGSGTVSQGNDGGYGSTGNSSGGGGGGGGSAAGQDTAGGNVGADGGAGKSNSYSGSAVTRAGGGGSGRYQYQGNSTGGDAGTGGGGAGGGDNIGATDGGSTLDAPVNKGGGGGGRGLTNAGQMYGSRSGNAGSGLVIIRYLV